MSEGCSPVSPESARSIAADPSVSWRLLPAVLTNFGSAWTPAFSWPVAACIADSEVYDEPKTYIVPALVSQTRLWSTVVVGGAESQTPMFPVRRAQEIPL